METQSNHTQFEDMKMPQINPDSNPDSYKWRYFPANVGTEDLLSDLDNLAIDEVLTEAIKLYCQEQADRGLYVN